MILKSLLGKLLEKKLQKLFCLFVGIFALSPSFAQHGGIGGGGLVVCPDPEHPGQFTAVPHEIFESQSILTIKGIYKKSPESLDQFLYQRLIRNEKDKETLEAVRAEFDNLFQNKDTIHDHPNDLALRLFNGQPTITTFDLFAEYGGHQPAYQMVKKGCILKNAFRYYYGRGVVPDDQVFKWMKHYSKNMVIMKWHEYLYRIAKQKHKAKNSRRSRELLEYALSKEAHYDFWANQHWQPEWTHFNKILNEFWDTDTSWEADKPYEEGLFGYKNDSPAPSLVEEDTISVTNSDDSGFDCRLPLLLNASLAVTELQPVLSEESSIIIGKSDSYEILDWINASAHLTNRVGARATELVSKNNLPFSFFNLHPNSSKEVFLNSRTADEVFTDEREDQYSTWVDQQVKNADRKDYEIFYNIIKDMNSRVGSDCFCQPTDSAKKYKFLNLREAKEIILRRYSDIQSSQ